MSRIRILAALVLCGVSCVASAGDRDKDYADAMSREHARDEPVPAAAGGTPAAGVHGGPVTYGEFSGYLARPEGGPKAGLLTCH